MTTDTLDFTTARAPTLEWSDALGLELDFMDDTHREFVDLLGATETAEDDVLLDRFVALIAHTEEHFGSEDRWMADTHFSSSNCHSMQHNVILQVMRPWRCTCAVWAMTKPRVWFPSLRACLKVRFMAVVGAAALKSLLGCWQSLLHADLVLLGTDQIFVRRDQTA